MDDLGAALRRVTDFAHTVLAAPIEKGSPHDLKGLARTAALLSHAVYERERPASVAGYALDYELSGRSRAVYVNKSSVFLALRGTSASDFKDDLHADGRVLVGEKDSPRFQKAERDFQAVRDAFPRRTLRVTGHSLGGSLALHLNELHGVAAYAFNPGVGLGDVARVNPHRSLAHLYVIKGDPVCALAASGSLGHLHVYDIGARSPLAAHAMTNFLPSRSAHTRSPSQTSPKRKKVHVSPRRR
jgi:hypothetical protein